VGGLRQRAARRDRGDLTVHCLRDRRIVGFLLPWTFARPNLDPAIGSGPIGTVIQDIMSIAVYLLVALALL
jgi:hypothetical protein